MNKQETTNSFEMCMIKFVFESKTIFICVSKINSSIFVKPTDEQNVNKIREIEI